MAAQATAPQVSRSQPADSLLPGISACLIVRDEEQVLARCLASLVPFVDELCVVDTGSADQTVEIALQFGAKLRHVPWQDDWSSARNASLELATRRWILVIDADEELTEASGVALRSASRSSRHQAFLVSQHNLYGRNQVKRLLVPRLFRNRPEIRYQRRIHESVMASLIALGEGELPDANVHLMHYGLLDSFKRDRNKHRRNLSILRECYLEDPSDLYLVHKLACSLREPEEREERLALLARALEICRGLSASERRSYPFLPVVFEGLAAERRSDGRLKEAIELADEGLSNFPESTDLLFLRGDLARRVGAEAQARKFLGACVSGAEDNPLYVGNPDSRGAMPIKGLVRPAVEADRIDGARLLVGHALSMKPDDASLRRLEIEVNLAESETSSQGISKLERLMEEFPADPEVQLISGQFAWSNGETGTALSLWRRAAEHDSDAGLEARCLLSLGRLSTGDLEGALELQPEIIARDLPSAACKLVLAVIESVPIELDPAFDQDRLTAHVLASLQELLGGPGQLAAERFAANACGYSSVLPRIGELLVED